MTREEAAAILINYFKPPIIRNDGKSVAHLLALEAIALAVEALDAEPIVRCKDCKHYLWLAECNIIGDCMGTHGYCAWGERREDESD